MAIATGLLLSSRALAQDVNAPLPWHLPEWSGRQVVEVVHSDTGGRINTGMSLLECGPQATAPDGRDLRVVDEQGRPVRHQVVTANREPLTGPRPEGEPWRIQFEITDNAIRRYLIYFGNADAQSATGTWEKRMGGLTLETRANAAKRHANNWREMTELVAASKVKFGEGLRRQINDPENPFGPNEQYLSVYRGLIHCPVDGVYGFATDSDDSSFLLINGVLVAQWAGSHNPSGLFDHNGSIELKAGVHRIEYYHVQTTGGSLARAGWRPPGSDAFVTIPPEAFGREMQTEPIALEARDKLLCAFFTAARRNAVQFGHGGAAFATYQFTDRSRSAASEPVVREWDFGDGAISVEANPSHIFVAGKTYTVRLRCTDKLGFDDTFERQITISALADTRVDIDMELASEKSILLPNEAAAVHLKCRMTGQRPITFTLVTHILGSSAIVLDIRREDITLTPGVWKNVSPGHFSDEPGRPAGRMHFALRYHDTIVAEREVSIHDAAGSDAEFSCLDGALVNSEKQPVVLRLGEMSSGRALRPAAALVKQNTLRVLTVDDSLAGGERGGYHELVAEGLRRRLGGVTVEVRRIGLEAGSRTYDPLRHLVEYPPLAREWKPDIVLVAASLRDVLRFMPVERFEANFQALVERIEAVTDAQVVLVAPPPTLANPGLSQAYAMAVKRVGIRRCLPVADTYSLFIKTGERTTQPHGWRDLYRDADSASPLYHMSPTRPGQEVIASAVLRLLMQD